MINLHKIAKLLWQALPWALLVFALLFAFQIFKAEKRAINNIAILQEKMKTYENKLGSLTATVGTLQITKRQLEQTILEKNESLRSLADEFSRVSSVVEIKTVTQIDSIPVVFEIPVPCEFTRTGIKKNEWYSFKYEVDQNGLSLSNFQTWTETTTITGFKRKWFLGRQYATTDVTHTNPNITTIYIRSIEVVVPVQWYDTRVFNIGLGVLGAAILLNN